MRLQMKYKGEPMHVDVPDMDELKRMAACRGISMDDMTKAIAQLIKNKIKNMEVDHEIDTIPILALP